MIRVIGLLLGLFVLASASPALSANGEDGDTDREFGGLGLGARYARSTNQNTDEGSNMAGVMLRARSQYLGIEGAVDYHNEDLFGNVDLKSWPVTASLLLYPLPVIYGLAGVGWYNTTLDFPSESLFKDDTSTDFGFHFGAGAEVPIAPAVRLTGDVRWQYVDYRFEDIPDTLGDVDADAFAVNAGILFYLR